MKHEMKHIFKKGTDDTLPTLVLLHGTGGTEHDLLSLGETISSASSVLSVRGNVLENGMPRFFRRLAEGVFDIEDLVFRTNELNTFLDEAAELYQIDRRNMVAVGYSNGANIAASLLFHDAKALKGAILHHPMVPIRDKVLPDLSGVNVFITAGNNDPICPPKETEDLEALLTGAQASVTVHWENSGHQLSRSEAAAASDWFDKQYL